MTVYCYSFPVISCQGPEIEEYEWFNVYIEADTCLIKKDVINTLIAMKKAMPYRVVSNGNVYGECLNRIDSIRYEEDNQDTWWPSLNCGVTNDYCMTWVNEYTQLPIKAEIVEPFPVR